jgi:hypothetical protein
MPYIQAILSDVWVQVAIALVVVGLALAAFRRPKNPVSRKHAIWFLWAICFGILATWTMRQESFVLAGGLVSSTEQPVAVPIKGTVRYVPHDLAYRHDASMWVLLLCGLGFVAAYKLARVGDEA